MVTPGAVVRPETVLRMEQNSIQLDRLVALAEAASSDDRPEGAAVLAQLAAHHAWQNPTGALYDARLERLLLSVGLALRERAERGTAPTRPARPGRQGGDGGYVLHVLTEAHETGGHSRLAWRWIERDQARSSVVLTQARSGPPPSLEQAVTARGGRIHDLADLEPTLTGRAAILRALAAEADFVILHVHPFDVVPVLGLAGCPQPVVYVNHADHCFWLGLAVTTTVCDHRLAGQRVTAAKRLVGGSHRALLPLPIDIPGHLPGGGIDRAAARRNSRDQLGVGDDEVLAITVAHEGKTRPLHGPGLADILEDLAGAHPHWRAVVVGPGPDSPSWSAVADRTGGRVRALGVVSDPAPLLAAADIYLDSTPVGSITSLLEAVAAGLPPVSLFRFAGLTDVFGTNAPGLGDAHSVEATMDGFFATMADLIEDGDRRRSLAAEARRQLQDRHGYEAWTAALADLYRRAAAARPVDPAPHRAGPLRPDPYGALLSDYHSASGMHMDLAALVAHHRRLMSPEVAAAAGADLELGAMMAGGSGPAGTGGGRDDRPPTLVLPVSWPRQIQWLSATFARMGLAADPSRLPLRVVLPLPERVGPDLVEAAVSGASRALTDAGLDPSALPFDVVIGDDDGVRSAAYPWRRLVLSGTSVPDVGWLRSLQVTRPTAPADDDIHCETKETPTCPTP